mmetsp:Transcript_41202/g.128446  ORF Transcript_41202/g.128446 Transcript_41202/m.128446 type:complete len:235 (+) Transcript_41202:2406-3110(+)
MVFTCSPSTMMSSSPECVAKKKHPGSPCSTTSSPALKRKNSIEATIRCTSSSERVEHSWSPSTALFRSFCVLKPLALASRRTATRATCSATSGPSSWKPRTQPSTPSVLRRQCASSGILGRPLGPSMMSSLSTRRRGVSTSESSSVASLTLSQSKSHSRLIPLPQASCERQLGPRTTDPSVVVLPLSMSSLQCCGLRFFSTPQGLLVSHIGLGVTSTLSSSLEALTPSQLAVVS